MLTFLGKALTVIAYILAVCSFLACAGPTPASIDSPKSQQGITPDTSPVGKSEIVTTLDNSEDIPDLQSTENRTDLIDNKTPDINKEINNTAVDDFNSPDRVDVVYFHRAQRCVTCLCFEDCITNVVNSYYKEDLNSGKLTYRVVNLGDNTNKDLAIHYGAISSQLFLNSVWNGSDHIEDILEIWDWNCRGDKEGFEQKVRNIIESKLKGES